MKNLILTEQEKNRIKLLYEVNTPPSESVFVANKNPYKYDEYKSARQHYSSSLKDGDLFYKMINGDKYETWAKEHNNKLVIELVKSLVGKTVRYNDIVWSIDALLDDNQVAVTNTETNQTTRTKPYIRQQGETYLVDTPMFILYKINDNNTITKIIETDLNGLIDKYADRKVEPKIENYDFSYYKNPEIPDEFYEIRKIQRFKTDFK